MVFDFACQAQDWTRDLAAASVSNGKRTRGLDRALVPPTVRADKSAFLTMRWDFLACDFTTTAG